MKLLGAAGDGMDIVAAVAGAWYVGAKFRERARRMADWNLTQGLDARPEAAAGPAKPRLLAGIPGADEDAETGAEELLAARLARFGDPVARRVERCWRWLAPLGWFRFVVALPLGVTLFGLLMLVCAVLAPVLIAGFLLDSDKDYRLRIVVAAFAVGIALQITSALSG